MGKKIKGFVANHKIFSFILGIALVFLIMLMVATVMLFLGNGSNAYGDRLKGIEDVKLEKKDLSNIEEKIMENESVQETKVRLQGKIVYVDIYFAGGTTLDSAKEIGNSVINEFSEDELNFYDIEVLLSEITEEGSETEGFNAIGTKHPSKEALTWNKG